MMMQQVGKLSIVSRFLNQPFRIYVRHTEEYMTEEFQKVKYIVAEASSLDDIKEDWERLENELIPIIRENILSNKRITLNDLNKFLLSLKKRSGEFGFLERFEFEQVGLKFNVLKGQKANIKIDEYGFLLQFQSNQPEMTIFIRPIHSKETLDTVIDSELKLLNLQFKMAYFNPYYYKATHLVYPAILLGYTLTFEEKTIKSWNMYIILNRFLYKFTIMSHLEIFSISTYIECFHSIKLFTPLLNIYENNGIIFAYDSHYTLKEDKDDISYSLVLQDSKKEEIGSLNVYFHDKLNLIIDKIIENDLNIENTISEYLKEKAFIFEYPKNNQRVVHLVLIKERIYHFQATYPNKEGVQVIHSVFQTFKIIE